MSTDINLGGAASIRNVGVENSIRLSREQLGAILEHIPSAVTVQGQTGELVYANTKAAELCGYPSIEAFLAADPAERLSRFDLQDASGNPFPLANLPGRLALQGRESGETIVRWRNTGSTGERWSSVRAAPVLDENGQVEFAVNIFRDVTLLKQTEEALRRSEARYHTLVDVAPDIIFSVSMEDGAFSSISPAFEQVTGWHPSQWVGKLLADLVHPDDLSAVLARTEQLRRGETPPTHDVRIQRASGGYVTAQFRCTPWVSEGRVAAIIGVARDVSQERRTASALSQSQQHLRLALEAGRMGIWDWEVSSATLTTFGDFNALLGLPAGTRTESLSGYAQIVHPEDREAVELALAELVDHGTNRTLEHRVSWPNGSIHWMEVRSRVIRDPAGEAIRMIGMSTDITERKQAEGERQDGLIREQRAREAAEASERNARFLAETSALLEASLEYEATLQSIAKMSVPALADWCVVHVLDEDSGLRLLGQAHVDPARVVLVDELQERFPPDPAWDRGIWQVIRTGSPVLMPEASAETTAVSAQNEEHGDLLERLGFESVMIVPLVARGRILGAISLMSGESHRRFGTDDLALAEGVARRAAIAVDNARLFGMAQQAVKARDQFLSTAAHELKTPVAIVKGYTQLLQQWVSETEEVRQGRALEVINRQCDRLHRLVKDLLEVSRLELGRLELDIQPTDLRDITTEVHDRMQAVANRHIITLAIEGNAPVAGDKDRLDQVLVNLIDNAMKFSPDGGDVAVRVERQGREAVVSVRDHGIGIPADRQEQVFQRFYQAHVGTQYDFGGMGIGLYISREIVVKHGGRMWLESTEGVGTTVWFTLPLSEGGDNAG